MNTRLVELCARAVDCGKRGSYSEAVSLFSEAIDLDPDCALPYLGRGYAQKEAGEYGYAILDFSKTIELDPSNHAAYRYRGHCYADIGKHNMAIKDFDATLNLEPADFETLYNRGLARSRACDHENAKTDFNACLSLNPNFTDAYAARGDALCALGFTDEAFHDFQTVLKLRPGDPGALYSLGIIAQRGGDYQTAISLYTAAMSKSLNSSVLCKRATAQAELGEIDAAIADYTKALEIDPSAASVWSNRGFLLMEKGKNEDALADFEKAVDLDQDDSQALGCLEDLRQKLGLAAPKNQGRAAKTPRELPDLKTWYLDGVKRSEEGEHVEAIRCFTKAIEEDPDREIAYHARGWEYMALLQTDKAAQDLHHWLEHGGWTEKHFLTGKAASLCALAYKLSGMEKEYSEVSTKALEALRKPDDWTLALLQYVAGGEMEAEKVLELAGSEPRRQSATNCLIGLNLCAQRRPEAKIPLLRVCQAGPGAAEYFMCKAALRALTAVPSAR